MSIKVSHLARKGFNQQPQSIVIPKQRIIIEFVPGSLNGESTLRAEGGLTQVAVTIALSAHLNALIPKMVSGLFQAANAAGLIDTKTGAPVVTDSMEIQTEEPTSDNFEPPVNP